MLGPALAPRGPRDANQPHGPRVRPDGTQPSLRSCYPFDVRLSFRHWSLSLCLLLGLLGQAGCHHTEDGPLGVKIAWLTPSGARPDDLDELRVMVFRGEKNPFDDLALKCEPPDCASATVPLAELPARAGRLRFEHELLRDLPVDRPIYVQVEGLTLRQYRYLGQAGPVWLDPSERRTVGIQMSELGKNVSLGSAPARFLMTATTLRDGRVLLAGGFESLTAVACPNRQSPDAVCYSASASDEAYLYDPASGQFVPVESKMLTARAGHTATRLEDGRVLLVGGSTKAMLVFTPALLDPQALTLEFIRDTAEAPEDESLFSFELFEPEDLATYGRAYDANLARGRFIGSAGDPAVPGVLNGPRFMHAAAATGVPGEVLLAGGVGGIDLNGLDTAKTFERFDLNKPGGYGVYANPTAVLNARRPYPSAIFLSAPAPGRTWIVGGGDATRDENLVDIYDPATGTVLTEAEMVFPAGMNVGQAGRDLMRPTVVHGASADQALVMGWFGPRCDYGNTVADYTANDRCGPTNGTDDRSFVIDGVTATAVPLDSGVAQSYASAVRLTGGEIAITGGILDQTFVAGAHLTILRANVTGTFAPIVDSPDLVQSRFLHSSAALKNGGLLTLGGLTFDITTGEAQLVEAAELYVPTHPSRAP